MKKIFAKILVLLMCCFASLGHVSLISLAATTLIPEGGITTYIDYSCDCPPAIIVYNYDYVTLSTIPIAYIPYTTILYREYAVYESPVYNVTQYIPTEYICMTYSGEECNETDYAYGIWFQLGTSFSVV